MISSKLENNINIDLILKEIPVLALEELWTMEIKELRINSPLVVEKTSHRGMIIVLLSMDPSAWLAEVGL